MIVAIYIKTESGDEYLELFVDKSVEQIKQSLYDNIESYEPVGGYTICTENISDEEETELNKMINEWYDYSWNREEEDYNE